MFVVGTKQTTNWFSPFAGISEKFDAPRSSSCANALHAGTRRLSLTININAELSGFFFLRFLCLLREYKTMFYPGPSVLTEIRFPSLLKGKGDRSTDLADFFVSFREKKEKRRLRNDVLEERRNWEEMSTCLLRSASMKYSQRNRVRPFSVARFNDIKYRSELFSGRGFSSGFVPSNLIKASCADDGVWEL